MAPNPAAQKIIGRGELELLEIDTKETLGVWYYELPRADNDYYYRRDGVRLIQSAQDFREGKSLSISQKDVALQCWFVSLDILKNANIIYRNRRSLRILRVIVQLELWGIKILKRLPKKVEELEQKLKALKSMLEQAQGSVTEAKVQTAINVGLTTVSILLGPAGLMGRALFAIGGFVVSSGVDALLGPDKYGLSTVNNAVADVAGAAKAFSKAAPVMGGIMSLKLDLDEIDNAEVQVRRIREEVRITAKVLESFVDFMEKHKDSISKLSGKIYFQNKQADRLFKEIDDAQANYDILEGEFSKITN